MQETRIGKHVIREIGVNVLRANSGTEEDYRSTIGFQESEFVDSKFREKVKLDHSSAWKNGTDQNEVRVYKAILKISQ